MTGQTTAFRRPMRVLVACAALSAGALTAFALQGSVGLVPTFAIGLAIACGILKTNTA